MERCSEPRAVERISNWPGGSQRGADPRLQYVGERIECGHLPRKPVSEQLSHHPSLSTSA
jgi:hypothetical protein